MNRPEEAGVKDLYGFFDQFRSLSLSIWTPNQWPRSARDLRRSARDLLEFYSADRDLSSVAPERNLDIQIDLIDYVMANMRRLQNSAVG